MLYKWNSERLFKHNFYVQTICSLWCCYFYTNNVNKFFFHRCLFIIQTGRTSSMSFILQTAKDKLFHVQFSVRTTNKADLACLFWYIKPDPQIWPQRQTHANPQSRASHLRFISYFHLIGGCFGVIMLWQWALCCGWAVYIALLETCWHRDEELSCSQGLDNIWIWIACCREGQVTQGKGRV